MLSFQVNTHCRELCLLNYSETDCSVHASTPAGSPWSIKALTGKGRMHLLPAALVKQKHYVDFWTATALLLYLGTQPDLSTNPSRITQEVHASWGAIIKNLQPAVKWVTATEIQRWSAHSTCCKASKLAIPSSHLMLRAQGTVSYSCHVWELRKEPITACLPTPKQPQGQGRAAGTQFFSFPYWC